VVAKELYGFTVIDLDCAYMIELTIAMLQEIKSRRADVLQELGVLQNNVAVVLALMNNEEVMKKMENMRDSKALNNYLTQESDVSRTVIMLLC